MASRDTPNLKTPFLTVKDCGSSQVLTGTDSGKGFSNRFATGAITLTLPLAKAGLQFTFLVAVAQNLSIQPISTDTIRGLAAGAPLALGNTVGNKVELTCVVPGFWEQGIASTITVGGSPISSIQGTANQITVTAAGGVATVGFATNVIFPNAVAFTTGARFGPRSAQEQIQIMPTGAGAVLQGAFQWFTDNNLYVDAPATGTPTGGTTFFRTGTTGSLLNRLALQSGGYAATVFAGAGGSKGILLSTTGGANLFSYSDASGAGWTNTDPYTSGALVYLNANSVNFYGGGAFIAQTSTVLPGVGGNHIGITNAGVYTRTVVTAGWLDGGYASAENGSTPGAIYCIGGNTYIPTASTLGVMYGIGYTTSATTGVGSGAGYGGGSAWGMYTASAGTARIFLNADAGNIWSSSAMVPNNGGGNALYFSGSGITIGGAGGHVTAQSGGVASGGNAGDIILIY